jgi:hypothetical protein
MRNATDGLTDEQKTGRQTIRFCVPSEVKEGSRTCAVLLGVALCITTHGAASYPLTREWQIKISSAKNFRVD